MAEVTGLDSGQVEWALMSLEAFLDKTEKTAEALVALDSLQSAGTRGASQYSRNFAWAKMAGNLNGPEKAVVSYASSHGFSEASYSIGSAAQFVKSYLTGELTLNGIAEYCGISVSKAEQSLASIQSKVFTAAKMADLRIKQ